MIDEERNDRDNRQHQERVAKQRHDPVSECHAGFRLHSTPTVMDEASGSGKPPFRPARLPGPVAETIDILPRSRVCVGSEISSNVQR